jgi:hypothetical protein
MIALRLALDDLAPEDLALEDFAPEDLGVFTPERA